MSQFASRCVSAAKDFSKAEIFFDAQPTMRLNEPSQFRLAISATKDTLPGPMQSLQAQGKLLVTCTIDARLVIPPSVAETTPTGWESRTYLAPDPSVWIWGVTPRTAGTILASLEVKPVVRLETPGGSIQDTDFKTQSYVVSITVDESPMDRVKSFTDQANIILGALTVIVAIAAILGVKKWGPAAWSAMRRRFGGGSHEKDIPEDPS